MDAIKIYLYFFCVFIRLMQRLGIDVVLHRKKACPNWASWYVSENCSWTNGNNLATVHAYISVIKNTLKVKDTT